LFARRAEPKVPGWREEIDSMSSLTSSKGRLMLIKSDMFRQRRFGEPWGYQRQAAAWPAKVQGTGVVGEKSGKFLGAEFYERPSQIVNLPVTPVVAPGRAGSLPPPGLLAQLGYGVRALAIRWWMIVLASAIVPALWGWGAVAWWRRISKEDRQSAKRCLACGYDMRATPGRCPECGEVSEKAMGEVPASR
ncbi:MAG TPA: hypothetical protein VGP94_05660, partial [Tepidisphaeraceae bacterium]|nr:hypothetical protein [Tepidisphaeraceae bacterium]